MGCVARGVGNNDVGAVLKQKQTDAHLTVSFSSTTWVSQHQGG